MNQEKTQHPNKQPSNGQLPVIPQVIIDSLCPMNWDEMSGDSRKRFCGSCQLHVHNFAEMKASEVDKVLCSGDQVCAKIIQRADGSIVTKDDRVSRRNWLIRLSTMAAAVAATLTLGCRGETNKAPIMGEIGPTVQPPPTDSDVKAVEAVETMGEVGMMGGAFGNPAWNASQTKQPDHEQARPTIGRIVIPPKTKE